MNVPADELAAAVGSVATAAAGARPFAATIGPAATFAPERPVVFLSVRGADGEIGELRRAAARGVLEPPGSRPERPFVPHVTLSSDADGALVGACVAAFARYERETTFAHLHLLEQDLGQPDRPWRSIASPALGGRVVRRRGARELELTVSAHLDRESATWAGSLVAASGPGRGDGHEPFAVVARERPTGARSAPLGVATGELRAGVCEGLELLVAPDALGEGIGSLLLGHVERLAAERGCEKVRVRTAEGGRAERFYSSRGYVLEAKLAGSSKGGDEVVLTRSLRLAR